MRYNYDRSFKFKFQDDNWEGYLITEDEMKELDASIPDGDGVHSDGDNNPAMIVTDQRCFFMTEGNINPIIVGHELLHMFVEYLYITSADIDTDQFEEIMADFIGNNIDKFIKKRNQLLKKFKKLETGEI